MTTTSRIPDMELRQAVPDWQIIHTDREPLSLRISIGQQVFLRRETCEKSYFPAL